LIISEVEFAIKSVRPEEGNLLSSDLNFQAARNRFYSEPLFIYFDMGLNERQYKQRYDSTLGETGQPPREIKPREINRSGDSAIPLILPSSEPPVVKPSAPTRSQPPASRSRKSRASARSGKGKAAQPVRASANREGEAAAPVSDNGAANAQADGQDFISTSLFPLLFGGSGLNQAPGALAVALAFESDALVVRVFLSGEPGMPAAAIPFISALICGPPIAPEAARYVPADTEVFLTASLDLPQMFDLLLAMANNRSKVAPPQGKKAGDAAAVELEKKLGAKIRDELMAALGGEVAFVLPTRTILPAPFNAPPQSRTTQQGTVLLIGVQNKEVVKAKLSPVLELLGLRGRGEKGVTEKRGQSEISAYNRVAVAFVNNFLILASDLTTMRRVLDSIATNQTLAATREYHDYMRWQPRQTLAQVYVSSAVTKAVFDEERKSAEKNDDDLKRFFDEYPFVAEPITYSAMADPHGPVYELRLPKSFVSMLLAGLNSNEARATIGRNEAAAIFVLSNIQEAQTLYRNEKGRFATLEELAEAGALDKDHLDSFGYRFDIRLAGGRYEVLATPAEYKKTGLRSFLIDDTGVIRGGDHDGQPATSADKPLSEK
jgi:hypothetical protein